MTLNRLASIAIGCALLSALAQAQTDTLSKIKESKAVQ